MSITARGTAPPFHVHAEVAEALRSGGPVVALESTIISHGLPRGRNAEVAREIEAAVRRSGAVPATIAIIDGQVRVGLDEDSLELIAASDDVVKASIRDVAPALVKGVSGATTVASTTWLASRAGIRVFATGGLGGVHRGAQESWDESADLMGLASAPIVVVCAGVKSILDVGATLERLETLSVPIVGYRTSTFPGFYVRETEFPVPWTADSPAEIAQILLANHSIGNDRALVVANPIAPDAAMDRNLHDDVLASGLAALDRQGIKGKDVTPFLLAHFHEQTHGESLRANIDLVLANASLAGEIAVAAARK